MLTKADFHPNLCFIFLGCQRAAFPLEADLKTGKLRLAKSNLRKKLCWVSFAFYALHVAYTTLRLPYLLLMGEHIPLRSLLWHVTTVVTTPLITFCIYTAFFCWPGITVTCFNKIFERWECEKTGKLWMKHCYMYSFQYTMNLWRRNQERSS